MQIDKITDPQEPYNDRRLAEWRQRQGQRKSVRKVDIREFKRQLKIAARKEKKENVNPQ